MPDKLVREKVRQANREVAFGVAVFIAVIFFVLAQSWGGRVDLQQTQVTGCLRSTLDRRDNAQGWRAAQRVRQAAFQRDGKPEDAQAAQQYDKIAASLESRTRTTLAEREAFCQRAFPKPRLIPHF
jgi:hypothetical protein